MGKQICMAKLLCWVCAAILPADGGQLPLPSQNPEIRREVREIPLKGLSPKVTDFLFPRRPHGVAYESTDAVGKHMARKGAAKVIADQVDSKRSRLLYYRWSGSITDRFTPRLEKGKVIFIYQPGADATRQEHTRLFVIPREATWEVHSMPRPPSSRDERPGD